MKWTTKEGKEIELKDLSNLHLLNIQAMLGRKIETYNTTISFMDSFSGEMAQFAAEADADILYSFIVSMKTIKKHIDAEVRRRRLK